ncbi:MAG: DUF3489 domain-containing protein [Oxalobacteraceae bacterium]|nr:MAG: DUF3489 domain-containing protein [Oxalobacteraceae bacterium]
MRKLNDLQSILLATAASRDSGSVYPVADSVAGTAASRLAKTVATLVKAGLAEARDTVDPSTTGRAEADLSYGVFITPAGATAIGMVELGDIAAPPPPSAAPSPPRTSKTSAVVALLARDGGATLPELIAATGWLPHTTRAVLTGLRKKGHVIDRAKRDNVTCYRIVPVAAVTA